jgi:hypothetical protein
MEATTYTYNFHDRVPMGEVDDSLGLAEIAVRGLHGPNRTRLETAYRLDPDRRFCSIEAASEVGRDFATIFAALLTEQFGQDGFTVVLASGR